MTTETSEVLTDEVDRTVHEDQGDDIPELIDEAPATDETPVEAQGSSPAEVDPSSGKNASESPTSIAEATKTDVDGKPADVVFEKRGRQMAFDGLMPPTESILYDFACAAERLKSRAEDLADAKEAHKEAEKRYEGLAMQLADRGFRQHHQVVEHTVTPTASFSSKDIVVDGKTGEVKSFPRVENPKTPGYCVCEVAMSSKNEELHNGAHAEYLRRHPDANQPAAPTPAPDVKKPKGGRKPAQKKMTPSVAPARKKGAKRK